MRLNSVAIVAYACQPARGSEPGAGLAAVSAWCRLAQTVHVLVQREDVPALSAAFPVSSETQVIFHAIGSTRLKRTLQRTLGTRLGMVVYYFFWIHRANRHLQPLAETENLQVIIHATFTSLFLPPVRSQPGIPILWGPLGGGATQPSPLVASFRIRDRILLRTRYHSLRMAVKINLTSLNRSIHPLFQNAETRTWAKHLGRRGHIAGTEFSGVALDEATLRELVKVRQLMGERVRLTAPTKTGEPTVLFTAARLVPFKAISLLIRTLVDQPSCILRIAGIGPQLGYLRRLASSLGVEDRTIFLGGLSRSDVFRELGDADAFVFSSLHDGSAWSVAEAYEIGLPIIILDTAGADCLGGREVGVLKVDANERVLEGFQQAVSDFRRNRTELWKSANARSPYFTVGRLASDYENALESVGKTL